MADPINELLAHMHRLYDASGATPPTPDQWREIQEKVIACGPTGVLRGQGNLNKVTEATVPVSC